MRNGIFYGIDFGSTNISVVEVSVDEGTIKKIYLAEEDEYPFASIVAISNDGKKMIFGRDVKLRKNELSQNYTIITSLERFLNENDEIVINGKSYSSVYITANFLICIKNYIKKVYGKEILKATFAVPIDFKIKSKKKLEEAAGIADITVSSFVSESIAGYVSNKNQIKNSSNILVVDWGGERLDLSILNLQNNKLFENFNFSEKIGGNDIDLLISEKLHDIFTSKSGQKININEIDSKSKDYLISESELAKIFLTDNDEIQIDMRNYYNNEIDFLTFTYEDFKNIVLSFVKRIHYAINKIIQQSNLPISSIDTVVLAGGSCNVRPFVYSMINLFGEEKIIFPEKMQWSVAVGASLIECMESRYCLNEDIGLLLSNNSFYPLLEKDKAKVGYVSNPTTFSLVEDSRDAHFIFTNPKKTINYGVKSVYTKGFLNESLQLTSKINLDNTARIIIKNKSMGTDYYEEHIIDTLKLYYDLSMLEKF